MAIFLPIKIPVVGIVPNMSLSPMVVTSESLENKYCDL